MLKVSTVISSTMSVFLFIKCCSGLQQMKRINMKSCMKMSSTSSMEYTLLGDSDLNVSKVCLGTMTWGEQNTMAEGIEQMDIAFNEYGVNFLDTAEMYPVPTKPESQGETDRVIAQWLKGRDRSKVILASKVCGASDRITWLPGREGKGARVSYNDIMVSVDESLKRLGTDYIDLLQVMVRVRIRDT
jgi:aryl-alcohol dehydrogenase-like predicted oxidoreductase